MIQAELALASHLYLNVTMIQAEMALASHLYLNVTMIQAGMAIIQNPFQLSCIFS